MQESRWYRWPPARTSQVWWVSTYHLAKAIFNAFIQFEHIPACILTGITRLIYKGKGKDPFNCHSFRGITIISVIMKTFEYVLLERILPVLENSSHPFFTQTAYRKCSFCQDAIFATQEAILKVIRDGGEAYLCLYDLEKAFDSIEHSILLNSLYDAGVNGKAWRVVTSIYNNLNAVVKSREMMRI